MDESGSGEGPPAERPGRSVADDAVEGVRSIVEAAESVADSLKRESELRARARLEQADARAEQLLRSARQEADELLLERRSRISQRSDTLIERTEALLSELTAGEQLASELRHATRTLEASAASLLAEGDERRVAAPGPPEAAPAPQTPAPRDPEGETPSRNGEHHSAPGAPWAPGAVTQNHRHALIVAVQMATVGGTREEISSHLQRSFGIADPSAILTEVFRDRRSPASS